MGGVTFVGDMLTCRLCVAVLMLRCYFWDWVRGCVVSKSEARWTQMGSKRCADYVRRHVRAMCARCSKLRELWQTDSLTFLSFFKLVLGLSFCGSFAACLGSFFGSRVPKVVPGGSFGPPFGGPGGVHSEGPSKWSPLGVHLGFSGAPLCPLFGVLRFSSVGLGPPFAWNLCPWTALQSLATACVSFYLIFGGVHLSSWPDSLLQTLVSFSSCATNLDILLQRKKSLSFLHLLCIYIYIYSRR